MKGRKGRGPLLVRLDVHTATAASIVSTLFQICEICAICGSPLPLKSGNLLEGHQSASPSPARNPSYRQGFCWRFPRERRPGKNHSEKTAARSKRKEG